MHNRYTLADLIDELTEVVTDAPDESALIARGAAAVERFVRDPDALPAPYRLPAPQSGGHGSRSYLVHRAPGLLITSVVWAAGAHVSAHDHRTWGLIGVIGNGIEETRYRRLDDGQQEGIAHLERERTVMVRAGEVSLLVPDSDEIHSLVNDTHRPTVELHVYGRDLVGLERNRYDVENGRVQRFASGPYVNERV